MDSDLPRMAHDLVILIYIRRPEIDQYVNNKHDVNDEVNDRHGVLVAGTDVMWAWLLCAQEEGGGVGGKDCRVDDEKEDDPVPHGFKWGVV